MCMFDVQHVLCLWPEVPPECSILSLPWSMSTSGCQNTALLILLAHVDLVSCTLPPLQDSTGEHGNLPRALLWAHHGKPRL